MYTVVYNTTSTLTRRQTSQISDTILRDDHLYRVFTMIKVRYHRYKGTNLTILCRRGRREDGEVGITGEVARTTDAIHHTGTIYVSGVDVAKNICFESGIDGDNPQTP